MAPKSGFGCARIPRGCVKSTLFAWISRGNCSIHELRTLRTLVIRHSALSLLPVSLPASKWTENRSLFIHESNNPIIRGLKAAGKR
jgi:hypothetical protein